ncbi:glycosyltransferase family 4 protein [Fodinibius sediminis]|uniref:Glycosyltransferase Family 4 n=1 Tax=Fodinibius sediminis TaxID=1214077 RepID=A0A521EMD6_9BACT|nr:glycosyltransferase family 1 protein [Fodinibius sediminis]SMO85086.1 Glycosyltransferase Family 4 [Fodinibius sediminis]
MGELLINGHFLNQKLTGVQRYAREVLRGFDRAGYAYRVLEPEDYWSSNKISRNLWQQLVLPREMGDRDVLWSPANSGPIGARNHYITLHDIAVFPHPEWFSSSYATWKRILIPRIARRARGILTVSEFSKSIICAHLDVAPHSVKVVYNGVDTDRFTPAPESAIQRVRNKYNLHSNYLLTLGSLDPRKNFGRTIQAWKRCKDQEGLENFVLAVAGGSNANFSRLDLDFTDDETRLLGYVAEEDLPALYSGAYAFLLPSLFEGFGLPVIESMACGTPVITSNTTALDEVSGDAALKVNPSDTQAIREGIMTLVNSPNLRIRLTELGRERARHFTWDKAAHSIYQYLWEAD